MERLFLAGQAPLGRRALRVFHFKEKVLPAKADYQICEAIPECGSHRDREAGNLAQEFHQIVLIVVDPAKPH